MIILITQDLRTQIMDVSLKLWTHRHQVNMDRVFFFAIVLTLALTNLCRADDNANDANDANNANVGVPEYVSMGRYAAFYSVGPNNQVTANWNVTSYHNMFIFFMFVLGCAVLLYPILPIRYNQFWLPGRTEDEYQYPDASGYGYQQEQTYHSNVRR